MEDHFVIRLAECNRCGSKSYEKLRSHGYCADCNYSPIFDESLDSCVEIPDWAIRALGGDWDSPQKPASAAEAKQLIYGSAFANYGSSVA